MIRVAILEDHQSIIDGYMYRLKDYPNIKIVGAAKFGEELHPILAKQPVDVLIMDVNVPGRPGETSPYPILHTVRELVKQYPDLSILVISIMTQLVLIRSLMEAGISGYIFKHDAESISHLGEHISTVANGGIYFSPDAHESLRKHDAQASKPLLTQRQLEVLGLCASYPELSTGEIAIQLNVASSTLRNLLSSAYLRLNVRTRAAALARVRQMGLLSDAYSGQKDWLSGNLLDGE